MSTRNTLLGFIAGAVAGGAAALLLAPERGETTRRKLREETDRLTGEVKDGVQDATGKVSRLAETHKEAAREAVQAAKETYREEMDKGEDSPRLLDNPMASR